MIREDREVLAELARLNRELAPLAMRIMDGSASAAEQHDYAQRLIAAGERLRLRADETAGVVIEGELLGSERSPYRDLLKNPTERDPTGSREQRLATRHRLMLTV